MDSKSGGSAGLPEGLVQALRGKMEPDQALALREGLGRLVRGVDPVKVVPRMVGLLYRIHVKCRPDDGPERKSEWKMLERSLDGLHAPEPLHRGSTALDWLLTLQPAGYEMKLKVLSLLNLEPEELKLKVVRLRDQVCGPPAPEKEGGSEDRCAGT